MDSESNDRFTRELSDLKMLAKKKSFLQFFFGKIFIELSGANEVIARIMPQYEKNILFRIGLINICFCIIGLTGIGYILFYLLDNWVAVGAFIAMASLFSYCLKTSFSASLFHSKEQNRWMLLLKRFFVMISIIISLTGITFWVFAKKIKELSKHRYYEKEYNDYRNKLSYAVAANVTDPVWKKYTIANYLATVRESDALEKIYNVLDQRKLEIVANVPSYYERINYDDSVRDNLSARGGDANKYTDILPLIFPDDERMKSGNLHGLSGITYTKDSIGNIRVLQNYYDSIFIARSQMDSIYTTQNLLKYLL